MTRKPYYDPKTKNTYQKFTNENGWECKIILAVTDIQKDLTDPLYSFKITRNMFGEEVSRERFYSHYVCYGDAFCVKCGKILKSEIPETPKPLFTLETLMIWIFVLIAIFTWVELLK